MHVDQPDNLFSNINAGNTAGIDVSKLKAGIYIVRLVTSEGNYSGTINIQ